MHGDEEKILPFAGRASVLKLYSLSLLLVSCQLRALTAATRAESSMLLHWRGREAQHALAGVAGIFRQPVPSAVFYS